MCFTYICIIKACVAPTIYMLYVLLLQSLRSDASVEMKWSFESVLEEIGLLQRDLRGSSKSACVGNISLPCINNPCPGCPQSLKTYPVGMLPCWLMSSGSAAVKLFGLLPDVITTGEGVPNPQAAWLDNSWANRELRLTPSAFWFGAFIAEVIASFQMINK